MGTIVRFALHGASEQAYRTAYAVLAQIGLDAIEGPDLGFSPGARAGFPAAAVIEGSADPAEVSRAAFVALHGARLRPVAVSGLALDRSFARASA